MLARPMQGQEFFSNSRNYLLVFFFFDKINEPYNAAQLGGIQIILFWPILDPLSHVSFGDTDPEPPSPGCDVKILIYRKQIFCGEILSKMDKK